MGIRQGKSLHHWNYFLTIESDVEAMTRYIEPCKANQKTYSHELARLLIASASEVDVLLKQICQNLDASEKASSVGKYEKVLRAHLPQIFAFKSHIPRWGLKLRPFEDWRKNSPPAWWTACNKVKHHRDTHFPQATLKNTLNSFAALYIANLYYHRELAENAGLLPLQRLIRADDAYLNGTTFVGIEYGINYVL